MRRPPIRWRVNVTRMTAAQLAAFRRAMTRSQHTDDDRGYQRWAGIHGLPLPISCQHSTSQGFAALFLPWHRAYLYFFERALRDFVRGVAQPWWDWTAVAPENAGLPDAYVDNRDPDGNANPLRSVRINALPMRQARRAGLDLPARTRREPGLPGTHLPTAEEVADLLEIRDFFTFSRELEDRHGDVHIYVGGERGHMSQVPLAAYDPIFWAHHAMIDRIWRIWQLRHPPPAFTTDFLGTSLAPFPMTVAQTLSVRALGYDYALASRRVTARS